MTVLQVIIKSLSIKEKKTPLISAAIGDYFRTKLQNRRQVIHMNIEATYLIELFELSPLIELAL